MGQGAGRSKGKRNAEQVQAQNLWKEILELEQAPEKDWGLITKKRQELHAFKELNALKLAEKAK